MFNIKIGTLISSKNCIENVQQLNPLGYESYALQLCKGQTPEILSEMSKKLEDVLEGRVISALCYYKNPLMNDDDYEFVKLMIENAKVFNCNTIGMFAGYDPDSDGIEQMMPRFKERYVPLVKLAEDNGVRLGFENCDCGGHWYVNRNMAYCPEAWDLIFDAIDSPSLGLEWEPAHMVRMFIDPIQNLRKYVNKVVHIHGKDLTIGWDIVRRYGVNSRTPYSWDRLPGFGDTNWCDVFTVLAQHGFKGSCDIEGYHDPVYRGDMEWTGQKTALDYLKRSRGGMEFIEGPTMRF